MEVLSTNDGLLTNLDAYLLIKERIKGRKAVSTKKGSSSADPRASKQLAKHRDWIEKEIVRHLKESPAATETTEGVRAFLSALSTFSADRQLSLTRAETLQLINARPVAPVEVHLVIEECAERLTDDDVETLLGLIATHLGTPPEESSVGQDIDAGSVGMDSTATPTPTAGIIGGAAESQATATTEGEGKE